MNFLTVLSEFDGIYTKTVLCAAAAALIIFEANMQHPACLKFNKGMNRTQNDPN